MDSPTDTPRARLDRFLTAIQPASAAQGAEVTRRLQGRHGGRDRERLGRLAPLCARLAAARHDHRPRSARKAVVLCAADHGVADPGVHLGAQEPTVLALAHIASGEAAVSRLARASGAPLVLVDCGTRAPVEARRIPGVVDIGLGPGTADIRRGPAMTVIDALRAVETGIALLLATADRGLDVVALGQLGAGCEIVSAALVAALSSAPAEAVAAAEDLAAVRDALDAAAGPALSPLTALEQLGGFDIAVLTGIILGAAAIHVPVVLDDHGTSSAALVASRMCPAVSGYLVAAHTGTHPAHRGALAALELQPLFDLGLAQGEGSGAVLALSFIDAASALSCQLAGDPPT